MVKIKKRKLTRKRLKEVLDYDMDTGIFTAKVSRGRTKKGTRVGWAHEGYRQVAIDGEHIFEHRLAWFYVTGKWPKYLLDHKNRMRSDNRFSNLREATPAENQHNRADKGYHWSNSAGKWVASIRLNYKKIHLGSFANEEDARLAATKGREKYHKTASHGT